MEKLCLQKYVYILALHFNDTITFLIFKNLIFNVTAQSKILSPKILYGRVKNLFNVRLSLNEHSYGNVYLLLLILFCM